MIQEIVTYLIIAAAITWTMVKFAKSFKRANAEECATGSPTCAGCGLKEGCAAAKIRAVHDKLDAQS